MEEDKKDYKNNKALMNEAIAHGEAPENELDKHPAWSVALKFFISGSISSIQGSRWIYHAVLCVFIL